MPLLRPQYFIIWKDASGNQAATSFRAVDDAAALHVATKAAAASKAKVEHFFKVAEAFEVPTHEPQSGSNVRAKAWSVYTTASEKIIKLSIPAFNESLLDDGPHKFKTDLLEGASRLTTRAGAAAAAFVRGVYNYGLRARDQ